MTLEEREMTNKTQNTKLDIARWIAIIPLTFAVAGLYYSVIDKWTHELFIPFIQNDFGRLIFSIKDAFVLPVIFIATAYLIAPKFKFKSTLISTMVYVMPLVLYIYFRNDYPRPPTSYLAALVLNYLIGLFVVYRLDKSRKP